MYYDINRTLSRQRLFNFVMGARGCGKTYGSKKKTINNFLRRKEQFVYLRRYDTELPAAEIRNFYDDIAVEFPEHEFKTHNGLFMIDKEVAGWYFPLSKATMLKSIPFPNVTLIIFDEFIIDTGLKRYLPEEVTCFLECYSTISRDRDVPVLFLSNALSMYNPYFTYFGIEMQRNQTLYLERDISVEIVQSQEFEEHMQNTRFGQLIKGTKYGDYAISNKFLLDTTTFIEPLKESCSYICTFVMNGELIGFYINKECNKWYLSKKVDSTCPRKFTMDVKNHMEDTILSAKNNIYISSLVQKFCNGEIRFDTQSTKNVCINVLKKLI